METRSIGESGTDAAVYQAACLAGGGPGVNVHTVNVPAATMAARFALFNDDTAGGADSDLDLIVVGPNGAITSSGNGGSNERVELVQPAAGAYKVCVIGYEPAGGEAEYKLSSWVLKEGAINGNFKALVPAYSYVGGTGTVSMSWSGLAANQRHLGALRYVVNGATQGLTMVEVNTNDPLPQFDAPRRAVVLAK